MYNIHYDICALFVIAVELIIYYTRRSNKVVQNTVYIWMAYVLLISTVCDLCAGLISNSTGGVPRMLAVLVNTVYFLTNNALPCMFLLYVESMTKHLSRLGWKKYTVLLLPYILDFCLIVANLFMNIMTNNQGIIFYIDEDSMYHRSSLMWILYAISIVYLVMIAVYVTYNRKKLDVYRVVSVYVFFMFVIIPVVLQTVFPYLLVQGFGISICFIIVFSYLEQRMDIVDSALGVYNKKAFLEMSKRCARSGETTVTMCVTMEDLSFLEKSFGMELISELEQQVGEYLKNLCKGMDIFHLADMTFYVIDTEATERLVACGNELVKKTTVNWSVRDVEIPLDLDIGIVCCPGDFTSLEEVVDFTNYIRQENHGRGSRMVFAKDFKGFIGKRKSQIRVAIQKALDHGTLQVYYQPIFSTKERRVNSAEALVRLIDDELGFISPEEFIPIAEEDGSILRIGEYVLDSVCRFIKEYDIRRLGIDYIEVNVSVIECMKYNMAAKVASVLNCYQLSPEQINLEITETAAMNLPHIVGDNMSRLVDYGIQFSLDDYGSGYSNINYLIDLPFKLIKVDKNIVWSAFENEKAGIALASSIDMILRLDYHIVAEGVETEEQVQSLTDMGCEYLQGYYFSKPLPQEQFLQYIRMGMQQQNSMG